ncbi:hypothetical protein BDB00DRAFT_873197 [Zychaea mexicana]|uniref:uncharacterized protein n=1 Tax=Zychaea mexicana TaxID=64656 RepID=UPI0022FDE020|nr:uncharacterized protein BDB00DRAFT_873197 [Zychaea mexicana]KAI9492621.1 hypothetical protein BDB00DRAFT_873197 [Zychaea mexicana]
MATDGRRQQQQQQKFLYHEKSKGMCDLLVHSSSTTRAPGGLVRRPVSFNKNNINKRNNSPKKKQLTVVKITIALDGSVFLAQHFDHDNIIQSIQTMAEHYQEHICQVTLLLDKLLKVQQDHLLYSPPTKATFSRNRNNNNIGANSTMEVTLPPSLFAPHPPSIGRARIWLRSVVGIDPEVSPGLTISEEEGDDDLQQQPVDPAYFKELQLFLDHVDSMIGCIGGKATQTTTATKP